MGDREIMVSKGDDGDKVCCVLDEGQRCRTPVEGRDRFSARWAKDHDLDMARDPTAGHNFLCRYHGQKMLMLGREENTQDYVQGHPLQAPTSSTRKTQDKGACGCFTRALRETQDNVGNPSQAPSTSTSETHDNAGNPSQVPSTSASETHDNAGNPSHAPSTSTSETHDNMRGNPSHAPSTSRPTRKTQDKNVRRNPSQAPSTSTSETHDNIQGQQAQLNDENEPQVDFSKLTRNKLKFFLQKFGVRHRVKATKSELLVLVNHYFKNMSVNEPEVIIEFVNKIKSLQSEETSPPNGPE